MAEEDKKQTENEQTEDASTSKTGKLTLEELIEESGDDIHIICGVLANNKMTNDFNREVMKIGTKFQEPVPLITLTAYKKAKDSWMKKEIK